MQLDAVRGALNDLRHCELELCKKIAERDYLMKVVAFNLELTEGDLSEPLTPELRLQVLRAIRKFNTPNRAIAAIAPDNNEAPISLFGKGASS